MGTYQNKWELREDWCQVILRELFSLPASRLLKAVRHTSITFLNSTYRGFYFKGLKYMPYSSLEGQTCPLPEAGHEFFTPVHERNLIIIDERIMLDGFITKMLGECSCNKDLYLLLPKTLSENQRAMTSGKPEPNITEERVIQFKADNKMGYQLIAERLAKNMLDM